MKKITKPLSDFERIDYPIKNIIEGWFFRIEEISQGYYCAKGIDRWGHSVSRDGIDPDVLLIKCKNDISEIFGSK